MINYCSNSGDFFLHWMNFSCSILRLPFLGHILLCGYSYNHTIPYRPTPLSTADKRKCVTLSLAQVLDILSQFLTVLDTGRHSLWNMCLQWNTTTLKDLDISGTQKNKLISTGQWNKLFSGYSNTCQHSVIHRKTSNHLSTLTSLSITSKLFWLIHRNH